VNAEARKVVAHIYEDVLSALPAEERAGFEAGLSRLAEGRLSTPVACERAPRRRT
jgi:hypothetical protein